MGASPHLFPVGGVWHDLINYLNWMQLKMKIFLKTEKRGEWGLYICKYVMVICIEKSEDFQKVGKGRNTERKERNKCTNKTKTQNKKGKKRETDKSII